MAIVLAEIQPRNHHRRHRKVCANLYSGYCSRYSLCTLPRDSTKATTSYKYTLPHFNRPWTKGKEFAKHKEIAKGLDVKVYFARPYHSWERGANENINGLIRQYIHKGTDFSELSDEFIAEVEWKLNNRPRKSLGYLTPLEYCRKMFNLDFRQCCTVS